MKRREPVNGDLFGAPPAKARDTTPLTLPMRLIDQTEKAWFLSIDGRSGSAKWAPKSEVTRGEGAEAGQFTMPRWVAADRGWL